MNASIKDSRYCSVPTTAQLYCYWLLVLWLIFWNAIAGLVEDRCFGARECCLTGFEFSFGGSVFALLLVGTKGKEV